MNRKPTLGRIKLQNSPSIRRMPSYLHRLLQLEKEGTATTSTTHLAEYMNLDPIIVRKDFALTGITGRPGIGFSTSELIESIQNYLGWNKTITAILIGVGSLGTALLGFDEFRRFGLNFVGIFDNDPEKIGKKIRGFEVLSMEDLPEKVNQLKPTIGVLCVSPGSAQPVVDILTSHGVKALWNFVNVSLKVPEGVVVQREVLAGGYALLSSKLQFCGIIPEED